MFVGPLGRAVTAPTLGSDGGVSEPVTPDSACPACANLAVSAAVPGKDPAVTAHDLRDQLVLITGASSGLGVEFAQQLAARGANLILVARREDRLRSLAERLENATGISAHVVAMDLARADAGVVLKEKLQAEGLTPTALINNAGFGTGGAFHEIDADRLRQEVLLDVASLTDITRAFIDDLRAAQGGFLINIASIAAFQPNPRLAVYSACKAYVLSLSESLWYESRDAGLRVLALCPGPTRTEFFDVAGKGAGGGLPEMEAPDVVRCAINALDKPLAGPAIVPGALNKLVTSSSRVVPRRLVALISGRTMDRASRRLNQG